jgi:hypothetical protein
MRAPPPYDLRVLRTQNATESRASIALDLWDREPDRIDADAEDPQILTHAGVFLSAMVEEAVSAGYEVSVESRGDARFRVELTFEDLADRVSVQRALVLTLQRAAENIYPVHIWLVRRADRAAKRASDTFSGLRQDEALLGNALDLGAIRLAVFRSFVDVLCSVDRVETVLRWLRRAAERESIIVRWAEA